MNPKRDKPIEKKNNNNNSKNDSINESLEPKEPYDGFYIDEESG